MAGQLRAKLLELGFTAHWGLSEVAGDALDLIGNANGTVTIGAGARGVAPLNDQGDGCMTFDALDTRIEVTAESAINDIWTGGGTAFFIFRANAIGEGGFGRIYDKGVGAGTNQFQALDLAGGFFKLDFFGEMTGGLVRWESGAIFPIDGVGIICQVYDSDSDANDPTWFVWDGLQHRTLTIGDGLTQTASGLGSWLSDSASNLNIGNRETNDRTWDGEIDELALAKGVTVTEAQAQELINLALSEIGTAPEGTVVGGQMAGNAPHSFRTRMVGI